MNNETAMWPCRAGLICASFFPASLQHCRTQRRKRKAQLNQVTDCTHWSCNPVVFSSKALARELLNKGCVPHWPAEHSKATGSQARWKHLQPWHGGVQSGEKSLVGMGWLLVLEMSKSQAAWQEMGDATAKWLVVSHCTPGFGRALCSPQHLFCGFLSQGPVWLLPSQSALTMATAKTLTP